MNLPQPEFLTLGELAHRWGYSEPYVHDLIRCGRIVPAITLTDPERYVGGEFSGGYGIGDIENATHKSYSEYYVGTVTGEDNHPENWPQCSRTVYFHSPVDDGDGYSFQFVSENSDPGDTTQWFYLDHGVRIGSVDAARRFRFVWAEINRFEAENATTDAEQVEGALSATSMCSSAEPPVSQLPVEQRVFQHKLRNRVHVLHSEIEEAKRKAANPGDPHSVWAELVKLAESEVGCFLGAFGEKLKYRKSNGEAGYFNPKALRGRMTR